MNEDTHQICLFNFYEILAARVPAIKYAFHTPNGGIRAKMTAARLKRMGVRVGVPDVLIPVTQSVYTGLAIELKYGKNRCTNAQTEWLAHLQSENWSTHVIYDWTHAAAVTCQYFGIEPSEYGLSVYASQRNNRTSC